MSAPELIGDTWLGTGGERWDLGRLRGRIVLLDFWTLCCVNCHHVLAELRPIEAEFADVLTVIGVHSPKFEHEKDPGAVTAAMQRHGITHPVLNDPNMSTWQAYGVRAWPTLVLLDTHGEVAATFSGEGHGHAIRATIESLIAVGEADGSLLRGPDGCVPLAEVTSPYLQPGKVSLIGADRLLVSDTGRHSLALASIEAPQEIVARIGNGERGLRDGTGADAQFNEPYGHTVLPDDMAERVGYDVVIADSANHALRGLRLRDHAVTTIAGTGEQWMQGDATSGSATQVRLSTPWDVTFADGLVYVAMAGEHRIWTFDPVAATVAVYAGTTNEGLVDGALADAWFAQPSALVSTGDDLWVVDAETSALRVINQASDSQHREVRTVIGRGLFDFGHVDGAAGQALLQHPLGADVLPDGSVVIADAYNGALRRWDPSRGEVTTIARDLAEPSDVIALPDEAAVLVVESAAGRLTKIMLDESTQVSGAAMRTIRPALEVAPGEVRVEVVFEPPPGEKRDDRYGPSTHLVIGSTPADILLSGEGAGVELTRTIVIAGGVQHGVLHVAAKGASCDDTTDPEAHPTCHIHQQDWGIPVQISPDGQRHIRLTLAG
jgi:thiol-disulfide isomerase/thioredoxin